MKIYSFCVAAVALMANAQRNTLRSRSSLPAASFSRTQLGKRTKLANLRNYISRYPKMQYKYMPRERQGGRKIVSPFATTTGYPDLEFEKDSKGRERLAFRESGWKKWNWKGYNINYVQHGEKGTPIVFVHGFGAHAYHWRYQIPELAKNHRVYSICLLGYGWSDKDPEAPYSADLWAEQVASFTRDVVGESAVLVGNSIGAVTALAAAASYPDIVKGLVMVNAAGRFGDMDANAKSAPIRVAAREELKPVSDEKQMGPLDILKEKVADAIAAAIFYSTRFRIPVILKQVYVDPDQVDDQLVKSIQSPALDPNALGTFQSIYRAPGRSGATVNQMMAALPQSMKVLLLWGQQDPWMQPEKADQIMRICDAQGLECEYVPLAAGHCPQDDNPTALNENLARWMKLNF
mmetsp:Transcript_90/g.147  ORF Transcript_90/g.147 Transcript_90/m.147 type:complete len:406 (+) Transcript_90:123-1340(+)